MKLVVLGSTGYHPNQRRHTACLMLPEAGVVLDAGTGFFRVRDLVQTPTLDIFLTHAHLDHIFGLTYLFDTLYESPLKTVRVHGEEAKLKAIAEHLFATDLFPVKPPFEWKPLIGPVTLPDGGRLSYFPLEHPGGAIGYRIEWTDRTMAYVTDTTARRGAPYVEEIRGVDVLVHECYFPDGYETLAAKTGHSCTTPVAQVAKDAFVGRLVLMHMNPLSVADDPIGLDVARAIFPATELAEDGMVIDV
jgi:ribonuclease BN (tRNA processing enzyme)